MVKFKKRAKKIGYVYVTFQALADFFAPKGNKVVSVWCDFNDQQRQRCTVVLEGPDLPECLEGELMQQIDLSVTKVGKPCPKCGSQEAVYQIAKR